MRENTPFFSISGPARPQSPVLLSVPHAGRNYPAEIAPMLRSSIAQYVGLEDRYADLLIEDAARSGSTALIATAPRLWIDLNRDEHDIDPEMIDGPVDGARIQSAKTRGGLGLIPRRTTVNGDIWRNRIATNDLAKRIAHVHRPYHAKLSEMLVDMRAQFGSAILLDVHSMPPVRGTFGSAPPQIVIGDLYGRSAHSRFTELAAEQLRGYGFRIAINTPYPGHYVLERHGAPRRGVHALQIEIDRRLYLDTLQLEPGPNLPRMQQIISSLVSALADEISGTFAIAAE